MAADHLGQIGCQFDIDVFYAWFIDILKCLSEDDFQGQMEF